MAPVWTKGSTAGCDDKDTAPALAAVTKKEQP
jgi:hypothetical protein